MSTTARERGTGRDGTRIPAGWKGPILLVSSHRRRTARVRQILAAERFHVEAVSDAEGALHRVSSETSPAPTVVLVDWVLGGDAEDLVFRLRPRRRGPRLLAIAAGAQAEVARRTTGVSDVLDPELDAEELVDQVWRAHHAVVLAGERP